MMIPLLTDEDGYIHFLLNIIESKDHFLHAEVFEVSIWEGDEPNTPAQMSLYLTAWIKWDGDSHITFGERKDGNQNGYICLGGKQSVQRHCDLMKALYKYASETIKDFDRSEKP